MHFPVAFDGPGREDRFGLDAGEGQAGDMVVDLLAIVLLLPDVRLLAADSAMAHVEERAIVADGQRSRPGAAAIEKEPEVDLTGNMPEGRFPPDEARKAE